MAKVMYNVPNLLSAYRIALVPVVTVCFYIGGYWATWIATWLFFIGCWTDFLDGLVARRYGQTSMLGKFLDSSADKIMVGGVMLLLVGFQRLTGVWILAALIIFVREILISGLREFLALQGVDVPVSWIGKWKAVMQMIASGFLMAGEYGESWIPHSMLYGRVMFLVATVMTVWSGWDYVVKGYQTMTKMEDGRA
jgi:cardiolipin synthase